MQIMKKVWVIVGAVVLLTPLFCTRYAAIICYPFILLQSYTIDPIRCLMSDHGKSDMQLERDYDDLMQRYIRIQAMVDFERNAREVIAFAERYDDKKHCIAQVLERHIGDDAHYIIIDKGSYNGLSVDSIVLYKNVLIGRVDKVYPFHADCMVITDFRSKVAGYIADSDVAGVAQGDGEKGLCFLHVSHLDTVKAGDIIISSGNGLIFPRGFGVARVVSVSSDGLFLNVVAEPLFDIRRLTYVAVIMR